jgi:hypothetical protein
MKLATAMNVEPSIYGHMRRLKLTPPDSIATISVCEAIFEVINITAMKAKSDEN